MVSIRIQTVQQKGTIWQWICRDDAFIMQLWGKIKTSSDGANLSPGVTIKHADLMEGGEYIKSGTEVRGALIIEEWSHPNFKREHSVAAHAYAVTDAGKRDAIRQQYTMNNVPVPGWLQSEYVAPVVNEQGAAPAGTPGSGPTAVPAGTPSNVIQSDPSKSTRESRTPKKGSKMKDEAGASTVPISPEPAAPTAPVDAPPPAVADTPVADASAPVADAPVGSAPVEQPAVTQ